LKLLTIYSVTIHPRTMSSICANLILTTVPVIDIAAIGAVLCSVLPTSSNAMYRTLLGSYVMWGIGFPLAHILLVIYFLRLILHKVYPRVR
jgi:Voltage-dependent anion channel